MKKEGQLKIGLYLNKIFSTWAFSESLSRFMQKPEMQKLPIFQEQKNSRKMWSFSILEIKK